MDEHDWEAEEYARALVRAEAIKADPKKMARAKKVLAEQAKANVRAYASVSHELDSAPARYNNPATIRRLTVHR